MRSFLQYCITTLMFPVVVIACNRTDDIPFLDNAYFCAMTSSPAANFITKVHSSQGRGFRQIEKDSEQCSRTANVMNSAICT